MQIWNTTEKKRRREIKTHLDMAARGSSRGRKRAQIKFSKGLVYPRSNGGEGFNLLLKNPMRCNFLGIPN